MASCGSGGSRPSRETNQGENRSMLHLPGGAIVRVLTLNVYCCRGAGVAELANALGLGPSGA
jgi:hypothetical protein